MSAKLIPGKGLPLNDPAVHRLIEDLRQVIRRHFDEHVCSAQECQFCEATKNGLSLTVENVARHGRSGPAQSFSA